VADGFRNLYGPKASGQHSYRRLLQSNCLRPASFGSAWSSGPALRGWFGGHLSSCFIIWFISWVVFRPTRAATPPPPGPRLAPTPQTLRPFCAAQTPGSHLHCTSEMELDVDLNPPLPSAALNYTWFPSRASIPCSTEIRKQVLYIHILAPLRSPAHLNMFLCLKWLTSWQFGLA
jgi:hypothetical protein